MSQLRQCAMAIALYASDNRDYIPPCQPGENWHGVVGKLGYLGSKKGPWKVLECPAEYKYMSNNGIVDTNYTSEYMGSSYAIHFSFSYYQTHLPRRGFSEAPDFAEYDDLARGPGQAVRSNAKLLIDCEAYNVGWNAASFAWSLDSAFAAWDPYYPYRHPGRTANVAYMDGHVGTFK